jgi:hypothetical protein
MNKIVGIIITLAFVGSTCFAQGSAKTLPAPAKSPSAASATKTVVGKVVSITIADPAKGITKEAISIVDEAGKTVSYTVGSVAKVFDNARHAIPLKRLKAGDKVKVKGKKTSAGEEAQSITLLK